MGKALVKTITGEPNVIYIDKHSIHEVTSPQAFAGIEKRRLKIVRPHQLVVTADIDYLISNKKDIEAFEAAIAESELL